MITLMMMLTMAVAPAQALEYDVEEPEEGMFAPSSSVEVTQCLTPRATML